MRSETRLASAVFQLTPTRTRCDLVIIANGKTEKLASGLVNPFISHLKTAQDQIARGGYSIKLEPDPGAEAAWFTKGTVERFVRFVSTPEVLERVNTIESEILQIDEAISIQGNENFGIGTVEEHHQMKSSGSIEGNKPIFDADAEKAIILYKPVSHPNPPVSNGSKVPEENSKVQLLRVLESRKKVLQKEQAMAFARTTAAGFDIENMAHLTSFAESFGAFRLMEACVQYTQLWKGKHETGQWIEVEPAEALSYRSEFSPLNSSGIILSGDAIRQKELVEAWPVSSQDTSTESNGNSTSHDNDRDKRFPSEPQAPRGLHEYYQGQFQHPAFPQWPMLSQTNPHGFLPHQMQAMPYYQNYPMNGQFFHPPPTPMEEPRFNTPKRKAKKKHSTNSDSTSTAEDGSDVSTSESEEESSRGRSSHHKSSHSRKKKGVVVIRNLNYIAGKRHEASGNGSESTHDSEFEENKDSKSSKRKDSTTKSLEISNVQGKDEDKYSQEADAGNWQAFQSFLLRAEEKMTSAVNGDILSFEKKPLVKKGQNNVEPDPILLPDRESSSYQEESIIEYDVISGKGNRPKHAVSADECLVASEVRNLKGNMTASQFKEIEGGVGGYRKATSDAFIMYGREKQIRSKNSSDPLVDFEHEYGGNSEKSFSQNVNDESFMVPLRPGSQDLHGADRRLTIDLESEFPSVIQRNEDSNNKGTSSIPYEPDDLTLMIGRARESESVGYDPAIDYDIQVPLVVKHESKKQEDDVLANTNEGLLKTVKEKKLKSPQGGLEKKRKDAMMTKMSSSRSTPLNEAQKRAEKLRSYKADLQKLKKEQEAEEIRRLEALKRERQKRIAARSGSNAVQSPATPQQHKPRLPTKVSPSSYKSSKFTDSEPGSNSPLQKLPTNIGSIGSNDGDKASKPPRSNDLSRSASSLAEFKKESMKQVGSSASERIIRLSEPKASSARSVPAKSANTIQVNKKPSSEEPQSKKISAIIQLDRTKSETLPELKIKAYRTPQEAVKNKPVTKLQKGAGSRTSLISESSHCNTKVEKTPSFSYSDDNPVIEKTVVMLENEAVHTLPVQTPEGKIGPVDKSYRNDKQAIAGIDTGYNAIRAPPSQIYGVEIENPTEGNQNEALDSYELVNHVSKDESEKFLDRTVPEIPYRAPFARTSSLEDPATGFFQNAEVPPLLNTEMTVTDTQTIKAHIQISDTSVADQTDESHEKTRNKESKGLKKLWKFARKGHISGSGDGNLDSNGSVVHDQMAIPSSSDTSTLKNLISQDETNIGGVQTKVSRPFSILSPFRGRNNEKKVAA
ncbi:hypothetical protein KFK09_009690 [Dendrobium nobile]|uniref:COP1-interacting protein 7 n=1 Tax=Dendrobium nobile TaxID=94219 RepID=A0A8T3BI76_DENNO|nr:hypothetical protein KFK09_009690 [Dendrobium nobile]